MPTNTGVPQKVRAPQLARFSDSKRRPPTGTPPRV